MITSAVTLSTIDHIFNRDLNESDHSAKYSEVASFLLNVGAAGLIIQIIMAVVLKLYFHNFIHDGLDAFSAIVSFYKIYVSSYVVSY